MCQCNARLSYVREGVLGEIAGCMDGRSAPSGEVWVQPER